MIRDRKLIKWKPFIMPEQKALLRKNEIEDMKVKKPEIDEYELLIFNDILVESLHEKKPVSLKLWLDGFFEEISPFFVTKIDPYQRKFHGTYKDTVQSFLFDSLVAAKRM